MSCRARQGFFRRRNLVESLSGVRDGSCSLLASCLLKTLTASLGRRSGGLTESFQSSPTHWTGGVSSLPTRLYKNDSGVTRCRLRLRRPGHEGKRVTQAGGPYRLIKASSLLPSARSRSCYRYFGSRRARLCRGPERIARATAEVVARTLAPFERPTPQKERTAFCTPFSFRSGTLDRCRT